MAAGNGPEIQALLEIVWRRPSYFSLLYNCLFCISLLTPNIEQESQEIASNEDLLTFQAEF